MERTPLGQASRNQIASRNQTGLRMLASELEEWAVRGYFQIQACKEGSVLGMNFSECNMLLF